MASVRGPVLQRKPRYDGEDTSPTTQKELLGWYSYGVAAEVFAVCGVGKHQICVLYSTQYLRSMIRLIPTRDS